jgi:hypothetical protein
MLTECLKMGLVNCLPERVKKYLSTVGIFHNNKLQDDSFQITMKRKRAIKKGDSKAVFYTNPSESPSY